MSILIKGMEMPKNCNECPMSVNGYCVVSPKRANGDALNKYETTLWCPLVEVPTPHGRLADADALLERLQVTAIDPVPSWIRAEIIIAPTIIEAEE